VRKAAFGPLLGMLVTVLVALPAQGAPGSGTLFGTDPSNEDLIRVDPATGAGTVVGPMGVGSPSLTVDPMTGAMYAGAGGGDDQLYRVDPATGGTTVVGSTNLGLATVAGMDFRADGILFAAVNLAGDGGTGADHLALIDPNTAAATVIGPFGSCVGVTVPSGGGGSCTLEGIEGIAFSPSGTLYGALSARGAAGAPGLYRIDPATGAATFLTSLVDGSGTPASGGFVSLQFGCDGTLFGGSATQQASATDGGKLARIDPVTGIFTFVGAAAATPSGRSLGGLAWAGNCQPPPGGHFQCYKGKFVPRFKRRPVTLEDQFGSTPAKAVRPRFFCNPVAKTVGGVKTPIFDPGSHLKGYRIRQGQPFQPRRVAVSNQFGYQILEVVKPVLLFLPTRKQGSPKPKGLDHYKCYTTSGASVDQTVRLKDQFLGRNTRVLAPTMLCNPVAKTVKKKKGSGTKTFEVKNPELHQVCYRTQPKRFKPAQRPTAVAKNQFGLEGFQARKALLLCAPSSKVVV
jgi:hypothetical protein